MQALAARSAGRAGGRSGFSSRAAAPRAAPRAAPQRSAAGPNVTNVMVAPPMFSPFGGFGYGFSPFGFGMPVRATYFASPPYTPDRPSVDPKRPFALGTPLASVTRRHHGSANLNCPTSLCSPPRQRTPKHLAARCCPHTRATDPPRRWCPMLQFGFGFGGGIIRLMITLFIIQVRISGSAATPSPTRSDRSTVYI